MMWVTCQISYRMFSFARHSAITTITISEDRDRTAKTAPKGTSLYSGSTRKSGRAATRMNGCATTKPTATNEIWR